MSDALLRVILLRDRKAWVGMAAAAAAARGVCFTPAVLELLMCFLWPNSDAQVHTAFVFIKVEVQEHLTACVDNNRGENC